MMKIGLYRRRGSASAQGDSTGIPTDAQVDELLAMLRRNGVEPSIVDDRLPSTEGLDFVLSLGGDGTLLSLVHLMQRQDVPIVGINYGHLGFLTTGSPANLDTLVSDLIEGRFTIEDRTLLRVEVEPTESTLKTEPTFVLNEVYVHRKGHSSLLHTDLFIEEDYVATYKADGLIVATPTGSTAYSLSCGGPILTPTSGCFVITPVAAHTLTLRPIIVPDSARLRLVPRPSRQAYFRLGMDSRSLTLPTGSHVHLQRAGFTIKLVRLHHQSFYTAIHDKLSWGR